MWNFQSKRNALHEQLLLAPETNPSEFVRRYLQQNLERQARRVSGPGSGHRRAPSNADRAGRITDRYLSAE